VRVTAIVETGRARRSPWRWLRRAVLALVLVLAAPYALAIAYLTVTPPSTLALWREMRGRPVERIPVPLSAISPHLIRAVVTSEDAAFCSHSGIDFRAIREAWRRAERTEGEVRGTSTITMQTAKNVFLWHGRSFVRKALEAPLALFIDALWGKRRVLETYLNVAEWGPGIFGAEAAARHHFGVSARDLTPRQAALLASALPNPARRIASRPSALHQRLADRLAARIARAPADVGCVTAGR